MIDETNFTHEKCKNCGVTILISSNKKNNYCEECEEAIIGGVW